MLQCASGYNRLRHSSQLTAKTLGPSGTSPRLARLGASVRGQWSQNSRTNRSSNQQASMPKAVQEPLPEFKRPCDCSPDLAMGTRAQFAGRARIALGSSGHSSTIASRSLQFSWLPAWASPIGSAPELRLESRESGLPAIDHFGEVSGKRCGQGVGKAFLM